MILLTVHKEHKLQELTHQNVSLGINREFQQKMAFFRKYLS